MSPLKFVTGFARAKIDPDGAELRRARRLRRSAEHVRAPRDLESHESSRHDRGVQLCLQQSAGDSALPEIDVSFRARRDGLLDEDVTDLKTAARLEYTRHFAKAGHLIGEEIQHAIRDDNVSPPVGYG